VRTESSVTSVSWIPSSAIRFANQLRAVTRCRVAVVPGGRVDRAALAEVARGRR
jgi:hypothetical protein